MYQFSMVPSKDEGEILSTSNRIPTVGSHVYFLLQVFWVILLLIVVPWQLSTGSKHDYLFLLLLP